MQFRDAPRAARVDRTAEHFYGTLAAGGCGTTLP